MYRNISVEILGNKPTNTTIKTISVDCQQFDNIIKIEEYEFPITKRMFTDAIEEILEMNGYIKIKDKEFKIMKIKEYDNYQEVWLYELERQVIE